MCRLYTCDVTENAMREKEIEQRLVQAVKDMGGIAPKFVSPGLDGVPDRLILLPGGHMAFAELKAPGQTPRPLQRHRIGEFLPQNELNYPTFSCKRI